MTRLLVLALLLLAGPALAQPPPELAPEIAGLGRVIAPPQTAALYAPLHAPGPWEGVTVTRDARYGGDARHRLDVFAPAVTAPAVTGTTRRPVLVFVHGGAFIGGDKQLPGDSPFYANVGVWAARHGMVGVNVTYRLAPANPYPAAQEDLGRALAWVSANIAAHGGDPAHVVLAGHSAGAVHAALYAADTRFHPAGVSAPVAYAFLSGLYDFADAPAGDQAYLGAEAARRSPLPGLMRLEIPILLAHASLDPERFVRQSEAAHVALCGAGRCPSTLVLTGHSHMSAVYAIGTADESLTGPLLAFIQR